MGDTLSTHTAAAFYEGYSVVGCQETDSKDEFVYTPAHGSWLNMVEIRTPCWCASASSEGWRTWTL